MNSTNEITSLATSFPEWPPPSAADPLAVLVSGGLDSSVMLAEALRAYPKVYPIYLRTGLLWENVERAYLERFLEAVRNPALQPLVVLDQPCGDLYGRHWSVTGEGSPIASDPNDADFLPGRNVLLFAKPLLWCHLNGIHDLATAPLISNPFPDATAAFYDGFAGIVGQAVGGLLRIIRPYAHLHKPDVILRGKQMPLHLTFSCILPEFDRPCGTCIKCGERQAGFREAGVIDPTDYAHRRNTSTA